MNNVKKYSVYIKGVTPLIMHNDTLCDPLLPISKQMKEITCIRKKTDEHHLAMARIEFEAALYYNENLGVYMPSKCLLGCIKAAAKKYKKGKQTKAVILDEALGYPLIPYKGKNPQSLYDEESQGAKIYVHRESIVVNMSKVMRTRPIFHRWEVKFGFLLDTELLPERDMQMILDTAGYEYGLCELRPGLATGNYGTFRVEEFKRLT